SLLAKRLLVPAGAIFAAAPDIGEDIGPAVLNPEQAKRSRPIGLAGEIGWRLGRSEAPIGMDEHAGRLRDALLSYQKIGNTGSILRHREMLVDGELRRIELRRKRSNAVRLAGGINRHQRRRGKHPLDGDESNVLPVGGGGNFDRAVRWKLCSRARPAPVRL